MILNNKERAYLTSLAARENSIMQIGKDEVSPELIKAVEETFNTHELIKLTILKNCFSDPREIGETIAGRTRSTLVRVIGRKVILYKPAKEPQIILPKKNSKTIE